MLSRIVPVFACSLLALFAACGESDGTETPAFDAGNAGGVDADTTPSAFTTLIEGTWTKSPGSDSYHCVWLNVEEDIYITGFDALAPTGTHHTVLSVSDNYTGPNKQESCDVGDIADQMLYASGVGTGALAMPQGVAIKVSAGQTLMLNLHLFNISDNSIDGVSGTLVTTTTVDKVQDLAEYIFAGPPPFYTIPGDGQDFQATGGCTMPTDGKVFALWPHMHQTGKHIVMSHGGVDVLDEPFDFNEQKMYPVTEFEVKAGDKVNVTCTWNNTGAPKSFGDLSTDEMCFGGLYKYPASNQATGICFQ